MSTIRLCVIGNSHIVAVKKGWPLAGETTVGFVPTFFAAPGNWMADLQIVDGKLAAGSERAKKLMALSSGGENEIDPTCFDAFLVVGMFVRFKRVVRIYENHRLASHAGAGHQLISESALAAATLGLIEESAAAKTIESLRTLTSGPIALIPEPLPSEKIVGTDPFWSGDYFPMLHDVYLEQLQRMAATRLVDLVTQEQDTIMRGAFTAARYSVGAVQMLNGKEYQKDEFLHMNSEFGAKALRSALGQLRRRLG